jgi:hypothetical protein
MTSLFQYQQWRHGVYKHTWRSYFFTRVIEGRLRDEITDTYLSYVYDGVAGHLSDAFA